jgi:choline monooxygenase
MQIENKLSEFYHDSLNILPIELAETLPSFFYTSPEFFHFDQKNGLGKSWQYICHLSQLTEPGGYITATVAGKPVIVIKGPDDQLKGFYNVCRHRAGPLAAKSGKSGILQCQYHGWTYNLNGELCGTPEFEGIKNFEKANYSLRKIAVEAWEGLVFVNLNQQTAPLNLFVEGISERIKPNGLANKSFHSRVIYEVNCNWKVYVENYLEGYHLPHVHPELNKLLDYKNYFTETFKYNSLQYSPLNSADNLYGGENGEAFYYFIFPNMMLNILPGRLQLNLVVPVSHNQTEIIFDYFYDDLKSAKGHKMIKDDLAYSDVIQAQDIDICQLVQKGLESEVYEKGRLSVKREQGIYHFQNLLREVYRNEP